VKKGSSYRERKKSKLYRQREKRRENKRMTRAISEGKIKEKIEKTPDFGEQI
jgi:hypothetical protein